MEKKQRIACTFSASMVITDTAAGGPKASER